MIGARNLKKNGNSLVGGCWSGWFSHFFLCLLSLLNSYSQMFSSRQAEKWLFSRSSRCFCTCDHELKKVDAKTNLAKSQKFKFTRVMKMSFIAPLLHCKPYWNSQRFWNNDVKVRFGSNQGLWLASFECILGNTPHATLWPSIISNQSAIAVQDQHCYSGQTNLGSVFLFAYLHTDD